MGKSISDENFILHPVLAALAFTSNLKEKVSLIEKNDCSSAPSYWLSINTEIAAEVIPIIENILNNNQVLAKIVEESYESSVILENSGELKLNHLDVKEYKLLNPDLRSLTDQDAIAHYNNYGLYEARNASFASALFSRLSCGNYWRSSYIYDVLNHAGLGYDFDGRSSQLKGLISTTSQHKKTLRRPASKEKLLNSPTTRRSILFHVFYPEEVKHYIPIIKAAKKVGFSLYVSTPLDAPPSFTSDLTTYKPFITKVPNIGRDILGFKASFDLARYLSSDQSSAFLLLHTKKSPHVHPTYRKAWVKSMVSWMMNESSLDHYSKTIEAGKLSMAASAESACYGFGEVPSEYFNNYIGSERLPYASGTMFLASQQVLSSIFDKFTYIEFTKKPIITSEQHLCGGIPHAAERLFSYEAQIQSGIAWI